MVNAFENSVAEDDNVISAPLEPATIEHDAVNYNMNHDKRGLAIIFNHEFYMGNYASRREGTNVDCKLLTDTLEFLDFETKHFNDLKVHEITKTLSEIASMDHSNHDCLVISVLSHGDRGTLYAADSVYKAGNIWMPFTDDKCPTLAGKPKIFFIQACQGNDTDPGIKQKERTATDGMAHGTIECYKDVFIAYSTIPGFYSWRNPISGSWFIRALCKGLRDNGRNLSIAIVLTFVAQNVAVDYESYVPEELFLHEKKQIPYLTSMLTRLVTFPKKNINSES